MASSFTYTSVFCSPFLIYFLVSYKSLNNAKNSTAYFGGD